MNQTTVLSWSDLVHESTRYRNLMSIAILTAATTVLYLWLMSPLSHIPGPFLAKFTNLWRFYTVFGGQAEKQQRQLHDKYGAAVRLGPNMVSISDPEMIRQIYSRKEVLRKSDLYAVNDLFVDGRRVPNVFSTRDENHNTRVVKPMAKVFSMNSLLKMEPLIDSTISFFLDTLDWKLVETGKACEMSKWLQYCAWDVISEITYSKRMGFLEQGTDVQNMCRIGAEAMDYFSLVGTIPWMDLLLDKNPVKRTGPPFFTPTVNFVLQRMEERKRQTDRRAQTSTPDFLDRYLEAQDMLPDIVTDDTIMAYCMSNIIGGADTVAVELRSILYHLCRNNTTMAKLQTELDEANMGIPLGWTEAKALPYLCACVEEAIRLFPGISSPLERVVGPGGMTLSDGVTYLPAGTAVGMNPWVVNRDVTVFGEEPDDFRPERWLKADNEDDPAYQQRVTRMRDTDLTFGSGKRHCIGKNLALLECHKIIGSLVKTFDIELVEPDREWTTCTRWFIRQSDMDMRLTRRK